MVDNARGDHIHIEVRHHVCTYHHCTILFIECLHHCCQGIFIFIHIVAVQLYGKLATLLMMYTQIPATAYTQIIPFGDDVDEVLVGGKFTNSICRSVGRVIVDDDEVEFEICFLI